MLEVAVSPGPTPAAWSARADLAQDRQRKLLLSLAQESLPVEVSSFTPRLPHLCNAMPSGTPQGLLRGSTRQPRGLLRGSTRQPLGLLRGSTRQPRGLLRGSTRQPRGLLRGSTRQWSPGGALVARNRKHHDDKPARGERDDGDKDDKAHCGFASGDRLAHRPRARSRLTRGQWFETDRGTMCAAAKRACTAPLSAVLSPTQIDARVPLNLRD